MAEYSLPYELVTPWGTIEFNDFDVGDRYQLSRIDGLASASLRTASTALVARDGELVQPAYSRGRYPVLAGQVVASSVPSRTLLLSNLNAALVSIRRANGTLKWTPSGGTARQLTVRAWEAMQVSGGYLKEFQFGLVSGDPTVVSQTEASDDSTLLSAATGAATWTLGTGAAAVAWSLGTSGAVADWVLGTGASPGIVTVTNDGNADAWPRLRIVGQVGGAVRVENLTTGQAIVFDSLPVEVGHYAELNTWDETVYLDGQSNQTLVGGLDVAASFFFPLVPGANSLRLYADSFDATAKLTVLHRDSHA